MSSNSTWYQSKLSKLCTKARFADRMELHACINMRQSFPLLNWMVYA